MAIAYRSRGQFNGTVVSGSVTIPAPSGLTLGDLMIAHLGFRATSLPAGTLSGWTNYPSPTSGLFVTNEGDDLLYRIADSGDVAASNFTFTHNQASAGQCSEILAFSGVDTTTPMLAHNEKAVNSAATSGSPDTLTTITAGVVNSMLVGLSITANTSTTRFNYSVANTNPSWDTTLALLLSAAANTRMYTTFATYTLSTATGTISISRDLGTNANNTFRILALNPSSPVYPVNVTTKPPIVYSTRATPQFYRGSVEAFPVASVTTLPVASSNISGTSTVLGDVQLLKTAAGTIAGVATTSGDFLRVGVSSGTIAGLATVAGAVSLVKPIAAQTDGLATVTGAAAQVRAVAAQSDGLATVTGAVAQIRTLAGTIAGTSTVTGDILLVKAALGTIPGTSTVNGDVQLVKPVAAGSTGTSTVAGDVTVQAGTTFISVAGTITGTSTVTGAVTQLRTLTSQIDGAATVTGLAIGVRVSAGTITGTSTTTGAVSLLKPVTAPSDGTSTVTGLALKVNAALATIPGTSTTTGQIIRIGQVGSTVPGTSTVTGNGIKIDLSVTTKAIAGIIAGTSSVIGAATRILGTQIIIIRGGGPEKPKAKGKKKKEAPKPTYIAPIYKLPPVNYAALRALEIQLSALKTGLDAFQANEILKQEEELKLLAERARIAKRDAQDEEDILSMLEFF